MTVHQATDSRDFPIEVSDHAPGLSLPQRMGSRLWFPMWLMAVPAFIVALVIGVVRSNAIAGGEAGSTISSMLHVQAGVMFVGFATVFAAIAFAVARILGVFKAGGGEIQEIAGVEVLTLKTPATARVLLLGMMVAMIAIFVAVIIHFITAADVASGAISLEQSEAAFVNLEAVRRMGVALYLVAITFGLATITKVLRFQTIRVREIAGVAN